ARDARWLPGLFQRAPGARFRRGFAAMGRVGVAPDRAVADAGDETGMGSDLGLAQAWPERPLALAGRVEAGLGLSGHDDRLHLHVEAERRLPAADQLDIDLGQKLGVEQRAVPGAVAVVD